MTRREFAEAALIAIVIFLAFTGLIVCIDRVVGALS